MILETGVAPALETWPGLASWPRIDAQCRVADGLHCVLGDAEGPHHVWLREGVKDQAPACIVPRDGASPLRHLAALRLDCRLAGRASPRGSATLVPTSFQRRRLTLFLNILDTLETGGVAATMHGIASALIYPRHTLVRGSAWKASNERRRTRRLVGEALALRDGGYRDLFRSGVAWTVA